MKRIILFSALFIIANFYQPVFAHDTVTVCLLFDKISNINFKDHEYTLDFWCQLKYPKNIKIDFTNKLQVLESKKTKIILVNNATDDKGMASALLKINCVMMHLWNVRGYPFDDQKLPVIIYLAGYDSTKFVFKNDGHSIHIVEQGNEPNNPEHDTDHKHEVYKADISNAHNDHDKDMDHRHDSIIENSVQLESGWSVYTSRISSKIEIDKINVPSDHEKKYSVVKFNLAITRSNSWGLFFKLFTGMYTAILVAVLALFINIKNMEPRFALAVGALFAAIANKYIIEGILPESPVFNLADQLHAITFIAIILVIFFSVRLTRMRDRLPENEKNAVNYKLTRYNRGATTFILVSYTLLTALFMIIALRINQ